MAIGRADSEVAAANGALAHLGEGRLTSLTETRPAALYCRDNFGTVRDALLRLHNWNFATHYETLSQDPTLAEGRFTKTYPLPADCEKVREVLKALEDDWSVEGRVIKVNGVAETVNVLSTDFVAPRICYTRRVTDVAAWDALFLQIFQFHLAAQIATLLSRANGPDLKAQGDALLPAGRKVDNREAARSRASGPVSYLDVRRV